ncbi:MAG: hypothetical protein P1V81_10480 [Planctomycetota bacterium]|nr:hypothetical protein [Planctomycetota bacterium]
MTTKHLRIPVEDAPVADVAALFDDPGERRRPQALLLAHGAGADMHHAFLVGLTESLVALGYAVLRFQYPFTELMSQTGKRRPADRMPALESTHLAAHNRLRELLPQSPQVLIGKSMGGRVGSHLVARGLPCCGMAFVGYPLHPAGKPWMLRDGHFDQLYVPALFLQGTRDKLADLDLLRKSLEAFAGEATLEVVEGADHGFALPKSMGITPVEVHADLAARIHRWIEAET